MLLLAGTFLVGGLAGMAAEEALGLDWFDFLDEDRQEQPEYLLRGLDLSAAQRERVERLLAARAERLEEFWTRQLPEVQLILDRSLAEIRAVLTPAQRERFERNLREPPPLAPEAAGD